MQTQTENIFSIPFKSISSVLEDDEDQRHLSFRSLQRRCDPTSYIWKNMGKLSRQMFLMFPEVIMNGIYRLRARVITDRSSEFLQQLEDN